MGEWYGNGLRFGITSLPHDRIYWFATWNCPENTRYDDIPREVRRRFADWGSPVPELLATTQDDHFLHNDIVDREPIATWSLGRALIIGDAAHSTTPNMGQGGCMAIEDAYALSHLFQTPGSVEAKLKAFQQFRHPRTTEITQRSWRLGKVAQWSNPIAAKVRDSLFSVALKVLGPGVHSRRQLSHRRSHSVDLTSPYNQSEVACHWPCRHLSHAGCAQRGREPAC